MTAEPTYQSEASGAKPRFDFSHYSITTAAMVANVIARGDRPTDEMYLEAAERIEPPLMPLIFMQGLRRYLDPAICRRGRPRKHGNLTPQGIARRLSRLKRDEVPKHFLSGLIERLVSGTRFREFDRAKRTHLRIRKMRRHSLEVAIYKDILDRMSDAREIDHPSLGRLVVPAGEESHRAKALAMTISILSDRLKLNPPSPATFLNKISHYSR